MNMYFVIGVIVTCVTIWVGWRRYRWYKRIVRRCSKCGGLNVQRVCKIDLAPGEVISFRNLEGKWRWWIRRLYKLVFMVCKEPGCGWVELVKIDRDPISMWHAKWVKRYQPEQYHLTESALIQAKLFWLRRLYLGGWKSADNNSQTVDIPPLRLPDMLGL